ncbi:hypothetical protein [Arthrobacter gengyunqii]|uniref:Serine/threonine protein kinase n=1 Tax=Arthrobacter gengyunqii TaxID=2886940 RepID=A0ABS8GFR8_9MICC|nr:hypothetical protein [Arthrobacter gengyunqii]MCC3265326.1 hypothetical protein [Arthrobacter gengyunqii]
MTNGPESADAPRRSRRAADVPVDAPAGPRERESQQRARDREALRAYKALTDKQARADESANPPTRRQLRLQQQQRAGASAVAVPAEPAEVVSESDVVAESKKSATEAAAPVVDAPPAALSPEVRPGGRRDRRRRAQQDTPPQGTPVQDPPSKRKSAPAPKADGGKKTDPNADIAHMSVEQALVAREALQAQARNQVAAMEAIQAEDPNAVDLELLAQQKALAERAAVLNRRTQNMQRISQENEQRKPSANDPATAHNLAMVTPLEFVRVPGVDRPVMRRPPTSHVPVVTSSTTAQSGKGVPAPPQGPPRAADKRFEVRRPPASAEVRHSRILARADALVNAPLDPAEGAKPVGARSAFGLDPLDVKTAGLGRTRRLRFVSLGVGGLGILALIISVAMIVGGFGS